MATIFDLFEVSDINPHTTYSQADGNLLGVVDDVQSTALNDGEFDIGDQVLIGGKSYTINRIQEPASSGRFALGDGTNRSFDPGSESNLSVVFLTVSNGNDVRHFIIPNDSYGDMNVQSIRTGEIHDVAGSDAAVISTTDNTTNVVCFLSGTKIETPDGDVIIDDIRVGDLVLTRNNGPQAVRMILARQLDITAAFAKFRPIAFEKDSLGPGLPDSRLCVSPQHRILLTDGSGTSVLVPAKALTDRKGVRVMQARRQVTYIHLVFTRHEIIRSNGTFTESFFPGSVAMAAISQECRDAVFQIMGMRTNRCPLPAAPMMRLQQARRLTGTSGLRH